MASAGLGYRGLALNDLQHQGRLSLGCPALDFLVHQHAHQRYPRTIKPERVFSGSLHASTRLRVSMICSSLNFDFFIELLLGKIPLLMPPVLWGLPSHWSRRFKSRAITLRTINGTAAEMIILPLNTKDATTEAQVKIIRKIEYLLIISCIAISPSDDS